MDYKPDIRSAKQIELDNYLTAIMEISEGIQRCFTESSSLPGKKTGETKEGKKMNEINLMRLDEPPLHGKRIASYMSGVETTEQLARRMVEEHGYLQGAKLGWCVRFERSPRPYAESIEFVDLYLMDDNRV